jgi:hypothetical protein
LRRSSTPYIHDRLVVVAGIHAVPGKRAAEVVKDRAGHAVGLARGRPRLAEIPDRAPVVVKEPVDDAFADDPLSQPALDDFADGVQ